MAKEKASKSMTTTRATLMVSIRSKISVGAARQTKIISTVKARPVLSVSISWTVSATKKDDFASTFALVAGVAHVTMSADVCNSSCCSWNDLQPCSQIMLMVPRRSMRIWFLL